MHVVPHFAVPVGHAQAPFEQVWPWLHVVPHAPQLFGSVLVATHVLPHFVPPEGQAHAPPTQA